MPIDINKLAAAAAETYLRYDRQESSNGSTEGEHRHRLGGVGALALGAGLAVAARAVYLRARNFDLERAADQVEDKLTGKSEEDG